MKGITVTDSMAKEFMDALGLSKVEESKEVEATPEVVEEAEVHVCPLCESDLAEEISQDKLEEHANFILNILNEEEEGDSSFAGEIEGEDIISEEELEEELEEDSKEEDSE